MLLTNLTASAHPYGHRIDLSWSLPDPTAGPVTGVRLVRRTRTQPTGPDDGTLVADVVVTGGALTGGYSDTGLAAETVYYYALFPFAGAPPAFSPDPRNRVSAMATGRYDFAGRMYDLLPRVYQRYDTVVPGPAALDLAPADRERGELRRFLDLPGSQLDQLYSLLRAAQRLHDVDTVDGALLPLLAGWIGWRTDRSLPYAAQRNEIRRAPDLFATIGSSPAAQATVGRITGWSSRTKEYVHNVARTNQPERLNRFCAERDAAGTWSVAQLCSLNYAFDGRAVAVREADGSILFFFHTVRGTGVQIWSKRRTGADWQPSEPVVTGAAVAKHPAAALQAGALWLFWESSDPGAAPSDRHWQLRTRTRTGGTWSADTVFGDPGTERRNPATAVDDQGGLWLFWRERTATGWQVRYSRNDGTGWLPALTLPDDGGEPVAVDADLTALFRPGAGGPALWLFWARREAGGPTGQTRWSLAARAKTGADPAITADWSAVIAVPKPDPADHAREPAVLLTPTGDVELFAATTAGGGGWSVVRAVLDVQTQAWGPATTITAGVASQRGPCAVDTGAGTALLVFGSNAGLGNAIGAAAGETTTLDGRAAGSTTVRTTDAAKLALRGGFEDFQTYTYQSGAAGTRTDQDRVARDTVGLFVEPGAAAPDQVRAALARLAGVLPEFIPVTTRFVLVTP